jgi:hypothetical protein
VRVVLAAALALLVVVPAAAQDADRRRGFSIRITAPVADEFVRTNATRPR